MLAPRTVGVLSAFVLASIGVACAGGAERAGFSEDSAQTEPSEAGTPKGEDKGGFGQKDETGDGGPDPEVNEVYAQTDKTLYKLEPATKAVTVVGKFKDCEPIVDMALNEHSTLYAVSYEKLYIVDKKTAQCTLVSTGKYPNSLSFVPKGTLDPDAEALVGYGGTKGDEYLRININSGAVETVGKLGGSNGLVSSGDIASVKGGATYLTVKGGSCDKTDCLVEIDPATGKILKNWGDIEHDNVFGLSFWGGSVYGFDDTGHLFQVTFGSSKIVTTEIPIPDKPSGLSFWGAGSSTSAPLVSKPQ